MKKAVVLLLLVFTLFLAAPYFVGVTIHSELTNQIINFNKHPSLEISIVDYNRDWFRSRAEFELSINLEVEDTQLIVEPIKIIQAINHGPLFWSGSDLMLGLVTSTIEVDLPQNILNESEKSNALYFNGLVAEIQTGFDLNTDVNLTINAFELLNDQFNLSVNKGSGHISFDTGDYFEARLDWQGMNLVVADATELDLGLLTIDTFQDLVSGKLSTSNYLVAGQFVANLTNLNIKSQNLADRISLDDLTINLLFENINREIFVKIEQIIAGSMGQDPRLLSAQINALLPRLVENNPRFRINKIGALSNSGTIDSSLEITIDKSIFQPNNPMTLLFALVVNANGQAPEKFLEAFGVSGQVEEMCQKNWLICDNENLVFDFSLARGQVKLNGKLLTLGDW